MQKTRLLPVAVIRLWIFILPLGVILSGCAAIDRLSPGASTPTLDASAAETATASACPVTEPEWVKPPEDSAVSGSPEFGYYYLNQDRSIWASAWWEDAEDYPVTNSEEGIKVGWFRPAGATLEITGQRIDGDSEPLHAHVPCCYPTRFQATGLYFPTAGCWEVNATAGESELSFVLRVEPE
jgi:hypothetical protein